MATVSFKTDTKTKRTIDLLAQRKGINVSAYIKLILTKELSDELSCLTPNGFTVAEELELLSSHTHDKVSGPFKTTTSLMRALKK